MNFDLYRPFTDKKGVTKPGIKPVSMEWNDIKKVMREPDVISLITAVRGGDKSKKSQLPCICYVGRTEKTRMAANMIPTQLVMIDIDHAEDPRAAWDEIVVSMEAEWRTQNIILAHVTPSGKGLRIVFRAQENFRTLEENMKWFAETYDIGKYGDFDVACKDFSRLSFICLESDILYESALLFLNTPQEWPQYLMNVQIISGAPTLSEVVEKTSPFTAEEESEFEDFDFRGTPVKVIVQKYMEVYGEPSQGEKHNFYNEMVKNFRTICSNNKRLLLYILPTFGHTYEECWSQIVSICRVNTLSTIPKQFYFFLKDNGFYVQRETQQGALKEFMMNAEEEQTEMPPYLPPVFREFVGTAPKDFVYPCICALMPILGTLTSYMQAKYPYDDRMHTTSFFSVIYAPPGTGKGFVERFMDLLFTDLKLRDFVQSQRENVYLRIINRKGANDKAPELPHVSLRLIPAKNSEAEFLQKQQDNHGYHMFTYAAEMDSWAKGVKAAGGNKDDMIRIAWDNGEYGQQFKSANTFKGTVRLYWNVLITGTIQQVESYFKNVENGLVTRCSFMSIENQEFAKAPKWKQIGAKGLRVIEKFVQRCDMNTYETPCTLTMEDVMSVSDEDFDKEIDWRFKFRERQTADCSWIMPTIDAFHERQMKKAALDIDKARDVFRRRVGVRGFRLAILCTCLWDKPTRNEFEKCAKFIDWWMEREMDSMLKLWGEKYNEQAETTPKLVQRTVFNELPKEFSKNDVYTVCIKQGIKTPIRRILFDWKKLGYIEQLDKEMYKKK